MAVSLSTGSYYSSGGIVVFDDGTPRPNRSGTTSSYPYGSLQWGANPSVLYATSSSYAYDLQTFDVDATGLVAGSTYRNAFSSSVVIRFDPGTGLVYGEDGRAVDPATGQLAGTFPAGGTYSYYRRMVRTRRSGPPSS